jgi:hypothetical protein
MSAFTLFFIWLAALSRGGLSVREAGILLVGWVVEQIEQAEAMSQDELRRLHGWLGWAEWAARRADPRASVQLKGRGDGSGAALIDRIVAVARVLQGAPLKAPKRRARYGAKHRRITAYASSPAFVARAVPLPAIADSS